MLNLDEITQAIVFGDSLSDNGNSFALTFGAIPPPPYVNGRFSNGIVGVEYLAETWGLTINPYYDDGEGNNFAVGGARTGIGNSNNDNIAPFLPDVTLPGLADQIAVFEDSLNSENADSNALYLVWAGANDFLDYLGGVVPDDPAVLVEDGINNLITGITSLSELGAENLVVPNMPSLGRLPFSSTFQDEATAISSAFNGGLALALGNLELVPDPVEVDIFAATEAIIADPASFDLFNVSDPLLFSGLDSSTPGFFFWDLFHPTTEVHQIIADTIAQTIDGTIPQLTFNEIVGTRKRDFLVGTHNDDNIDGFAGKDLLVGRRGHDRLEGWQDRDRLWGNQGNDTMDGGAGGDYLNGGRGDDLLFGSAGRDILLGRQDRDIIIGGSDRDYLRGGAGDDYLLGGDGKDRLFGDRGNDILNGGAGKDVIYGNWGDDLIDGGAGNDILWGNGGADIFELTPNFGSDRIMDFQWGRDRLMLTGGLSFSDLSFTHESILVTATNETLAVLSRLDTTILSESDFV